MARFLFIIFIFIFSPSHHSNFIELKCKEFSESCLKLGNQIEIKINKYKSQMTPIYFYKCNSSNESINIMEGNTVNNLNDLEREFIINIFQITNKIFETSYISAINDLLYNQEDEELNFSFINNSRKTMFQNLLIKYFKNINFKEKREFQKCNPPENICQGNYYCSNNQCIRYGSLENGIRADNPLKCKTGYLRNNDSTCQNASKLLSEVMVTDINSCLYEDYSNNTKYVRYKFENKFICPQFINGSGEFFFEKLNSMNFDTKVKIIQYEFNEAYKYLFLLDRIEIMDFCIENNNRLKGRMLASRDYINYSVSSSYQHIIAFILGLLILIF